MTEFFQRYPEEMYSDSDSEYSDDGNTAEYFDEKGIVDSFVQKMSKEGEGLVSAIQDYNDGNADALRPYATRDHYEAAKAQKDFFADREMFYAGDIPTKVKHPKHVALHHAKTDRIHAKHNKITVDQTKALIHAAETGKLSAQDLKNILVILQHSLRGKLSKHASHFARGSIHAPSSHLSHAPSSSFDPRAPGPKRAKRT